MSIFATTTVTILSASPAAGHRTARDPFTSHKPGRRKEKAWSHIATRPREELKDAQS